MKKLKLNVGRTIVVTIPFFVITMFWQAYDTILPQILSYHFGLSSTIYGMIMGIDNVAGLFLLPLFGALSDRYQSKLGRRTPFILVGTIAGIIFFLLMSVFDKMQIAKLVEAGVPLQYAAAGKDQAALSAVVNAAASVMKENISTFVFFTLVLLAAIIVMSVFRSPAVALMHDCTPRPLRAQGESVLNILGVSAGFIFLILNAKFANLYEGGFAKVIIYASVFMLFGLLLFLLIVRENKWVDKANEENKKLGIAGGDVVKINEKRKYQPLDVEAKKQLMLVLVMCAMMYMGYNAYTSHFSVYAITYMGMTSASLSVPLLIRTLSVALLSIPAAYVASKIGYRLSCIVGLSICGISLFSTFFLNAATGKYISLLFILFAVGFALCSVTTGVMVVNIGSNNDNGRFTGYYYTATAIAQIITPTLAGILIQQTSYRILPIYAVFFFGIACVFAFLTANDRETIKIVEVNDKKADI